MLEPLSPSSTFELCVQALARALQVDVQPHTHEDRLLLVHYFAALVIGGQVPVHAHDGLGNTVLHYAARIGWAAGVASIFNSRVLDDDSKTGSLWDSEEKSLEQVQGAAAAVIRKNSSGCSALHCASVSGCLRTLHLLLQIAGDTVQDGYAQRDEITTSEKQRSEGTCDCTAVDYSNRTLLHYAASADDVKICAVALNLLHSSPFARDASALTPLHIALQHGCTAAACFIVTRSPATALLESPERCLPAVIDAITHWNCSIKFISACISSDPSLLFKLIHGRDLSSWATSSGRCDITNFIKRNQATLRALTGTEAKHRDNHNNKSHSPELKSYSLKKTISDGSRTAAAEIVALATTHMIPLWVAKRLFRKRSLPNIPLRNQQPVAFDAGSVGVSPRGARSLGQVQIDLLRKYACRIQYLMSRPVFKAAIRDMFARGLRLERIAASIKLQTAVRAKRCRSTVVRLRRLRDDITAAAAAEFRPTPEMIAAGLTLQRTYRGHVRGRRALAMLCQWRCGSASTWALASSCCMYAQLSKRFYSMTKCRSLKFQPREFRPMFPDYAKTFGKRIWMPSGSCANMFVQSRKREEEQQLQELETARLSAAPYCSSSSGDGYSQRVRIWPHFTVSTSMLLYEAATAGLVSDAALHWLQIRCVRIMRSAAAEFFASQKHIRNRRTRLQPISSRAVRLPCNNLSDALNFLCAGNLVQAVFRGHRARVVFAAAYLREQQKRCSTFLQAAQRGHVGRREFRRELWAKRSKEAAVILSKAAIAKLEIIAACAVRHVIWKMKFFKAVLKLQGCCRGWRTRNSNEYSRRRRIKSKIIRRLQNDSAITKLQRKIRAFKIQKAKDLGLDLPDESSPPPPPPPDPDSQPYAPPEAATVSPLRRMWPRLPSTRPPTVEQKKKNQDRNASMERIRLEELMPLTRPADATFAAAVLQQLHRSLFPHHAVALSPLADDKRMLDLTSAAAAFEDLKMVAPYGVFPEHGQQRELKFWRETDAVIEERAAQEELRQFGQPFPNLAPDDEESEGSKSLINSNHRSETPGGIDAASVQQIPASKFESLTKTHVLVPQLPLYLQTPMMASPMQDAAMPCDAQKLSSPSANLALPPSKSALFYVAAAPTDSDAPETRDLAVPWFWLHPIASTDVRAIHILLPYMPEQDGELLKKLMQQRLWLQAARVMRATLSQLLLGALKAPLSATSTAASSQSPDEHCDEMTASLALLVFMITAAHSIIALATGAEGQSQALLLKIPPPPPPAAAVEASLMSDASTILGMARALLSSTPLDSCKLHPKLQSWLGSVEACYFYHEQRNTAAAEALVQALVWESKYKAIGLNTSANARFDESINAVVADLRSSSLFLRSSITLQLCSVCVRCGDMNQAEQLALQALDSVSTFEVKKRDEHWAVLGACAELLLARICTVSDERAMEAQQWVRKASRSADRVAGPGRKSATRKPEALQIAAQALLIKAAARAVAKRSGKNELEAAPETGVLPA